MNIRKLLFASAIALCSFTATAQTAEEITTYNFLPHFYGQLQVGGQETLGEGSFGKLLSPNVQIALGYQFNPIFGARLGLNAWQSKATLQFVPADANTTAAQNLINAYGDRNYWKWNYIAPAVDLTLNLTNGLFGYNPERAIDWNIFAGVGANVAWNNKEAVDYNNAIKAVMGENGLQHIWDGTKARFLGRFGMMVDYRISKRISLGLELQANVLSDTYNSKKAPNADWYFNGLIGIKYTFGASYEKKVVVNEPIIVERIVERIVEKPVEVIREVIKEVPVANPGPAYQCAVFFTINSTRISNAEMQKIKELVAYLQANPSSKVKIEGFADNGTGTPEINLRLAKQRTQAVYNSLVDTYGISPDRITTDSMSNDLHQPFAENDMNRVVLCVVD